MGRELISVSEMVAFVPSLGTVLLWDDFEKVFKWTGFGSPAGYTVEKSQLKVWRDDYSMRFLTATPAAGQKASAGANFYGPINPGKKGFIDFFFYFPLWANTDLVSWKLFFTDGVRYRYLGIRYDQSNYKLQYVNSAGVWADVPGGAVKLYEAAWHRLTTDFNFLDDRYGLFALDAFQVDLSALSSYNIPLVSNMRAYHELSVQSKVDKIGELFVDDFYMRAVQYGK